MTAHVAHTEPYAWPYDGRIDAARLAVLLVGWDVGWSDRSFGPGGASSSARSIAAAVTEAGGRALIVAHAGAAPLALETDPAGTEVVAAPGIDGFYGSPLDARLRATGRTHLLVVGHGLEGPVHSTLRSANDRGYECLLVVDACTSLGEDLAEAAAKTVTMSGGIFGAIGATADVLAALAPSTDPTTLVTALEARS